MEAAYFAVMDPFCVAFGPTSSDGLISGSMRPEPVYRKPQPQSNRHPKRPQSPSNARSDAHTANAQIDKTCDIVAPRSTPLRGR